MKKYQSERRITGSYRLVGEHQTRPTVPEMKRVVPPAPKQEIPVSTDKV